METTLPGVRRRDPLRRRSGVGSIGVAATAPLTSVAATRALQRSAGNAAVTRLLSQPAEPAADQRGAQARLPVLQRALDHTKLPANTVGFGSNTGQGNRVEEVWILTDGGLIGSAPSANPPGYDYIRALGLTNFWIRFHLVNEKVGGPGSANNLVPASKRDNARYVRDHENALKRDARRAAGAVNADEQVFYGIEVQYNTAPTGSSLQVANAPFFPTSLLVYHEYYTGGTTNAWAWREDGTTFTFTDGQPTDARSTAVAITALTTGSLQTLIPGYGWDAGDLAFLHDLGGTRKREFTRLLDSYSGFESAQEGAFNALDDMPFSLPNPNARRAATTGGSISFGKRVSDQPRGQDALQTLAQLIATGHITL